MTQIKIKDNDGNIIEAICIHFFYSEPRGKTLGFLFCPKMCNFV